MQNIYSIIDLGGAGLSIEQIKVYVASQNIANANSPGYVAKGVNMEALQRDLNGSDMPLISHLLQEKVNYIKEQPEKKISLDSEALQLSNAELRYQVIAQIIQKKYGMMDLVFGGKK